MPQSPHMWRSLATLLVAASTSLATDQTSYQATAQPTLHPNNSGPITTPNEPPSQCEARTINYITHTLPQSCLTSAWASTSSASLNGATTGQASFDLDEDVATESSKSTVDATPHSIFTKGIDAAEDEASATPFMSFEDWKELMLRSSGQDPQELRQRKAADGNHDDDRYKYQADLGLESLGEEGEISLDFGSFPGKEEADPSSTGRRDDAKDDDPSLYEIGNPTVHRSKDAGKTCKERFSFASFDAGATILKTSVGAKNPKAILVENKDTYMLLECATKNKYVIVELTDDIWVDTIVLANFEFFSSMVRHFRISVSDRYPVKMEKWKELGIFEARNSREIQAFLVENPQIWAKYVRVEFLTHYGNEYYCPVSLIRVHGSRMLDKWKDSETGTDDDAPVELERPSESSDLPTRDGKHAVAAISGRSPSATVFNTTSARAVMDPFHLLDDTCRADGERSTPLVNDPALNAADAAEEEKLASSPAPEGCTSVGKSSGASETQITVISAPTGEAERPRNLDGNTTALLPETVESSITEPAPQIAVNANKTSPLPSTNSKVRSAAASGASSGIAPTIQEGFFNSMTKRLQQVESNLTLSLKYVEEQSKHIQDAFQKSEQKQLTKISSEMANLNDTMLAELRNFRDQYDQIWQSTVLALESQKDQSQRDILALSSRLNVLADEVIFQKRMAIVQAVLLLSCLCLVIFARGGPIPYFVSTTDQGMSTSAAFAEILASMQRRDMYPGSSPIRRQRASISQDCARGSTNASPSQHIETSPGSTFDDYGYQRPSPPLTPTQTVDESLSGWQARAHATAIEEKSQMESQQIQGRRVLPSLPENPASPGAS